MYHIYRITNLLDKKTYIGYTIKNLPERRWAEHKKRAKRGWVGYLYNAMRKHGIENFSFEILAWGENHEAGLKIGEPLFIEMFRPEYNMTLGGEGALGRKMNAHTKRKLLEANVGREWSEEERRNASVVRSGIAKSHKHKENIRAALLGVPLTEERKRKISEAHKGKILSVETKQKMSESHRRRHANLL